MGTGTLKKVQLRKVEEHDDKEISLNKPQKTQKSFIYQQMQFISVLENIKIYIKIASTCFGLRPSSGRLHMRPAKVIFVKCCHTTA
jgi:hypothetical protein